MTAMARANSSPFYPPRARWYSPVFGALAGLRRSMALDWLNPKLAGDVNLLGLIASFLVPTLGFYFRLPRLIGLGLVAWASLLALAFFLFLGQWEDNFIFGMLLSLHVSGFVHYCAPLFGRSLPRRLGFTLGAVVAIYLLVYLPAQSFLQAYAVEPLQVRERLVLVDRIFSTKSIRAGDWVAYRVVSSYENWIYVEEGTDLAQVLAVPGDQVMFQGDTYSVNGIAHPRLQNMPRAGKLAVPEKEWFIWPNVGIREYRDEGASRVPEQLMRMALVTEDQLIGKPFKRWFWWPQQLS